MKGFTTTTFIFTSLLIISNNLHTTQSTPTTCPYFSCNHHKHHTIRFPFRVTHNQTNRCGYPGFELTCNHDQTLLNLPSPSSHHHSNPNPNPNPYIVRVIDYSNQLIWISDPNHCLPERVLNLNLTRSAYNPGPGVLTRYSFYNCSRAVKDPDEFPVGTSVISCMSGDNYTVVATFEKGSEGILERDWKCEVIKRVDAPLWWPEFEYGVYPSDLSDVFVLLSWDVPSCGDCVIQGGSCGFLSNNGLEVGCFFDAANAGISRSVKIGLIVGIGIPGLICIIGLTFYISGKARARNQNGRHANNVESTQSQAIFPQAVMVTLGGLDRLTIESYPKTILGESKRLPKSSDGTCPICLSEYQPHETLRSIPECNHYYHAQCIDEWLRMNATCPLCRNLPKLPLP